MAPIQRLRFCKQCSDRTVRNAMNCAHLIPTESHHSWIGCRKGHWYREERNVGPINEYAETSPEYESLLLLLRLVGIEQAARVLAVKRSDLVFLLDHKPKYMTKPFLERLEGLITGRLGEKYTVRVNPRLRASARYWAKAFPLLSEKQAATIVKGSTSWFVASMLIRAELARPRLMAIDQKLRHVETEKALLQEARRRLAIQIATRNRGKRKPWVPTPAPPTNPIANPWVPTPETPHHKGLKYGSVANTEPVSSV